MNKLGLICTFLSVLFLINSQSKAQIFSYPDSLYQQKEYEKAALFYEKTYFELSDNQSDNSIFSQNEALLKKVYALKKGKLFVEASQTCQRFNYQNLPDSIAFKYRYEAVVCGFLSTQFEDCLSQIKQTRYFIKDTLLTNKLDFWEILTQASLGNYDESKTVFKHYSTLNNLTINIDSVYLKIKKNKFKNPKKAQLLATFLPGAGMLYVGKTGAGLTSILLQGGALAFGIFSFSNGYPISGFMTGFGLFQAFYFGGIKRTDFMVAQKNEMIKQQNVELIKAVLIPKQ